jgi:SulP family sulfate permease
VRLGSLIQFVPYPVTMGFTAGIGVVIATLQLRDFAGLQIPHMPAQHAVGDDGAEQRCAGSCGAGSR